MQHVGESELTGRQRRRLEIARMNGFLDATCRDHQNITQRHGAWCWQLKLPIIWFERRSPHSRYGRLRVEMFTTPNVLTEKGQYALRSLGEQLELRGEPAVSAYDACWDRVPRKRAAELARAVLRTTLKVENYELRQSNDKLGAARQSVALANVIPFRATA